MTDASEWAGRVGAAWAQEWRRTDLGFSVLTARLLDPGAIGAFTQALDIGCGAGEVSRALAIAYPGAQVLGIDISEDLLAVARARGANLANLAFAHADGARWTAGGQPAPDLLVSRHGVMFFAQPGAAFANLHAQAATGARLRFSCFRSREENEWATGPAAALRQPQTAFDPQAPGPFAFADPDRVRAILTASGWRDAVFDRFDFPMIVGQDRGESVNAVDDALVYFQHIGPTARIVLDLPEAERGAVLARLRAFLGQHYDAGRVALSAAAWIVTAHRD